MAQGKTPSFTISFIPEADNANWTQLGAVWSTKNGKLHTGEIIVPMAALATGSIRIAVREYEPKQDDQA
jgi:hypothetical protein